MAEGMLDRIRIILVRPIRSGNVGAVCRAMKNFGLSDLVLVAPECDYLDGQAEGFAARAKDRLAAARVVGSVAEALAECALTFATSAKAGLYRRQAGMTPREAGALIAAAPGDARIAVVFGPEDRGLFQAEILQFDRVIEIPADPEYPVLNLAAAATVICYELHAAARAAAPPAAESAEPLADDRRKQVLFEKLFDALERIGFFDYQQSPEHLRFALRRVLGRAALTETETDVLIGMAQQIRWYWNRQQPPGAARDD